LIVGNLDVQEHWRHLLDPRRPQGMARMHVLRVVSAAATLLRVFAEEGEELWAPLPVDPARLPGFDGVARVRLVSGARPREARLWWGEPTPVAARCDHRGFALAIQRELGCALPGAELVRDLGLLDRVPAGTRWVLKAPVAAAGRGRVFGQGPPGRPTRHAAANLLAQHGELLFEPWLDRVADYGCCGSVGRDGRPAVETLHRQAVDAQGRFLGILFEEIPENDARVVQRVFHEVAARLAEAGFAGPFGIDAWRSAEHLHPLGEINARLTFGHVARAWSDRLGIAGARFALGPGAPPPDATVLLRPGADDPTCAWLSGVA